jgi:hypothetical protein
MASEKEIAVAAAAIDAVWKRNGEAPFPFYPRELRTLAEVALEAAARVRAEQPQQAVSIAIGVCEVCPAVHVNLIDGTGAVYATASVPVEVGSTFIKRFRDGLIEAAARRPVPETRQ